MSATRTPLVTVTENGLYCPGRWVSYRSLATGGNSPYHSPRAWRSSAPWQHALSPCRTGTAIARHRLQDGSSSDAAEIRRATRSSARRRFRCIQPVTFSARRSCASSTEGQVWVVSGDYKRQPDPTCAAVRAASVQMYSSAKPPLRCRCINGSPPAKWSKKSSSGGEPIASAGLASVLFCYALGKAQRVLAELQSVHRRNRLFARCRQRPH